MARPALEVADILRDHGPAWREANRGHLSLEQLKVMSAIERCRTAALGGHVARCENAACGYTEIAFNSCRNRHCPKCQAAASRQWLTDREAELLAAILAADVAGSCRLIGIDEEGTLAQLKALRKTLFDPKIAQHHGRIVKNTGDGALVEFASVVDAVRCADDVQRGVAEQNTDVLQDKRIEFRIGIHVGDIIIEESDSFGDGVNIAVRLEGIAEPGGVCISDDAQRSEGRSMPPLKIWVCRT